jgi:hypothetical protein
MGKIILIALSRALMTSWRGQALALGLPPSAGWVNSGQITLQSWALLSPSEKRGDLWLVCTLGCCDSQICQRQLLLLLQPLGAKRMLHEGNTLHARPT